MDVTGYSYDPVEGKFFNRFGREVGSYTRKYGRLLINGQQIGLSRLAVKIMTGKFPAGEVDHIDRDTHNNKWDNLRVCLRVNNAQNKKNYVNSKSQYKGVYSQKYGNREYWLASIQANNKRTYLGSFKTEIEAAYAYDIAACKLHGEFANLNFK